MFQFSSLAGDAVLRTIRALLISLVVTFCALSGPLQAQFPVHGAAISKTCAAAVRACDDDTECSDGNECTTESCDPALAETTSCEILVRNVDDHGDSLSVDSAYDIIQAASGDVRVPASGDLPIDAVFGNTDCLVGPFAPCTIGPDIGAGPGEVRFRAEGYNPTLADPNPLLSQAWVAYTDLCDGSLALDCNPNPGPMITAVAATGLVSGCTTSDPISCDDGDACTTDSCNPATGQCETSTPVTCDDGNACTTESCNSFTGQCETTDTVMCDDGDACTIDSCDPLTGQCESTPGGCPGPGHGATISKACLGPVRTCDTDEDCNADGDACSLEHCSLEISDTLYCEYEIGYNDTFADTIIINSAFDIIDPFGAATRSPATDDAEIIFVEGNTNCVVGGTLPCSIGPDVGGGAGSVTFVENLYQPTALDPTPLSDQASVFVVDACDGDVDATCNPTLESSLQINAQTILVSGCESDGEVTCDDGDACTTESCNPATGQCETTDTVMCDDGDACTTESCSSITGQCEITDTVMCDDGDACTTDSCNPATGLCETTATVTCDDGNSCTDDACDPGTGTCVFTVNGSCNETPTGTDVEVNPIVVDQTNSPVTDAPDVSITFEDVVVEGTTTVVVTEYEESTTPPPSGFKISGLSGGPVIYDIESTATLGGGFEICFDYSSLPIAGDPADLALVHEVGGVWVDITSSNDTVNMILCGISDSFSLYAILESLVVEGPLEPVPVGTEVFLGVDVSGPPVADTVRWNWGDGTSTDATVTSSEVVAGHTYDTPGVYTVTAQLLLTSGDAPVETGSAEFRFVVVYDPSSGFVTGSGWIDSPEGAFLADPTRTGKAHFGFVSRYKKGAQTPSGNTEFQFQAGELSFRSSSYDWLVISGASARLKGTGTIDGSGNFGFMLTAVDEALTSSTDVDLFRIKIWDKDQGDAVVYDNEPGSTDDSNPTTAIEGGSIVIHKAKN